ncbi:MAG TPA: hypothetical protein VIG25_04910 [Pyrinomonadaceae bacterium]|jgi:hypothetical protein
MDWMNPLSGVLQQCTSAAAPPARSNVKDDFDQIAQSAPPSELAGGLTAAFRSDKTPDFGQMAGQLFSNSSGQERGVSQIVRRQTDGHQPASLDGRAHPKAEALSAPRKLFQEVVDVANRAGIDPSYVFEPHLAEAKTQDVVIEGQENLMWCCVPVIIDNDTTELFEMSKPNDNPEQNPVFVVTQSTANLVQQDFERYRPSLERMVEDWREAKEPLSSVNTSQKW